MNKPSYTVMVQNCFGLPLPRKSKRFKMLASYIQKYQPDFVLLQEVIFNRDVQHFQIDEYSVSYEPCGVFVKGGLVILSKKTITSMKFKKYEKQGSKYNLQLSDRIISKGILSVYIKSLDTYIINTHIVSTYGGDTNKDLTTISQVEQLIGFIEKIDSKLIVGGDFNIQPSSRQYTYITNRLDDITTHVTSSHSWDKKLDYIFVRGLKAEYQIAKISYDGFLSRHTGLLLKVIT